MSHESQKSHGLKGYRLTAGIGTGDNQLLECFAKLDIDWNDLLRIQKRMAAFSNVDPSFLIERRCHAVVRAGKACLGENKVQLCQDLVVGAQPLCIFRHAVGQFHEDGVDLFLLL